MPFSDIYALRIINNMSINSDNNSDDDGDDGGDRVRFMMLLGDHVYTDMPHIPFDRAYYQVWSDPAFKRLFQHTPVFVSVCVHICVCVYIYVCVCVC